MTHSPLELPEDLRHLIEKRAEERREAAASAENGSESSDVQPHYAGEERRKMPRRQADRDEA